MLANLVFSFSVAGSPVRSWYLCKGHIYGLLTFLTAILILCSVLLQSVVTLIKHQAKPVSVNTGVRVELTFSSQNLHLTSGEKALPEQCFQMDGCG